MVTRFKYLTNICLFVNNSQMGFFRRLIHLQLFFLLVFVQQHHIKLTQMNPIILNSHMQVSI